jgi:hypothetical protein
MVTMYDGAVLVVDAEEAAALIAEFDVDGTQFATSLLRDGDSVLELDPSPERSEPTTVRAHGHALALEKARKLLS